MEGLSFTRTVVNRMSAGSGQAFYEMLCRKYRELEREESYYQNELRKGDGPDNKMNFDNDAQQIDFVERTTRLLRYTQGQMKAVYAMRQAFLALTVNHTVEIPNEPDVPF